MKILRYLALGILSSSAALAQITTINMEELTPEEVGNLLAGPGITISNVKLTGDPTAAGSFAGGSGAGLGIESGVIMSTGDISSAAGPNVSQGTSGSLNTPGDADLDKIVTPNKTQDATILEFDFVTESENFNIKYVFASEEYQEFVGSQFNDVFAFFLNAQNIALIPNTSQPVAINSVNHEQNSSFYKDNPPGTGQFNTEFDGFTAILIAQATVNPGQTYHIKLAIADASDSVLDSAVFLAQGGITGAAPAGIFLDPREVFLGNSQSTEVSLTGFELPRTGDLTLSASGLPDDSTVTFSPGFINREHPTSTVKINIGPNSLPNQYVLVVTATNEEQGVTLAATMLVNIDCAVPFILGLQDFQPNSQSVTSGGRADLRVVAGGTGPKKYQWYQGPSGSTFFPVEGAASAVFTTPPVVTPTSFWVRVSNPCGSVDSNAAVVSPR